MPATRSQIQPMLRAAIAASLLTMAVSSAALAQDTVDAGDSRADASLTSGQSIQSSEPEAMSSQAVSDGQSASDDDSAADNASGDDYGSSNYHTPSQPVEDAPDSDAGQAQDSASDQVDMAPNDRAPSPGMYSDAPGSDADSDSGAGAGQPTDPDMASSEDD